MFNFIFTADKASKKPLYEQLYSYVADEIKNKNIIPYFNIYSTTKLTLFTINLPRNHYLDKYIYLIYLLYITYHHFFYYTVNFSLQINVYFLIC